MKSTVLILVFLALSQGRVLNLPKEAIDIPVTIVEDKEPPVALSLVKEELKPEEVKPVAQEEKAKDLKEEIPKEIKPEVKEEIKPEVKPEIKEEIKPEVKPEIKEEPKEKLEEQKLKEKSLEIKEQPQEIKEEVKQPEEIKKETPEIQEQPADIILKNLPAEEAVPKPSEELSPNPLDQDQSENQDPANPQVRQATQATPTQQTTTQGNFVQQLIQNSPIGQFLNQFQPQPAANPPAPAAVQADDAAAAAPATPAPTVPGFLNPQAAITSAQQAVQNAAQSAVNATTQAFQGIQQFASNLGNQFQNTLSSLTGQQQLAVSTTARPPGPIQQFVNNVFGGNTNATAAAAPAAQQSGNPLQGIINFLGGNRPQNAPAAAPAAQTPEKPAVDDKIDPAQDEVAEYNPEAENEVRTSGETIDDSFEDAAVPTNEVIVVNDDAGEVVDPVPNQPIATDAVAL
ncbi:20-hydroxyecdysone protein [Drosophila takahashii]|uniref:20-hydroxyecdysone protein n=1 Tax=Drosophila takahashii TaxID=29030 RepID=UPI001CF8E69C|nr:20-hydroxyecdysone protein [Drosophila takahashii]